jgi:hypothetical protein
LQLQLLILMLRTRLWDSRRRHGRSASVSDLSAVAWLVVQGFAWRRSSAHICCTDELLRCHGV